MLAWIVFEHPQYFVYTELQPEIHYLLAILSNVRESTSSYSIVNNKQLRPSRVPVELHSPMWRNQSWCSTNLEILTVDGRAVRCGFAGNFGPCYHSHFCCSFVVRTLLVQTILITSPSIDLSLYYFACVILLHGRYPVVCSRALGNRISWHMNPRPPQARNTTTSTPVKNGVAKKCDTKASGVAAKSTKASISESVSTGEIPPMDGLSSRRLRSAAFPSNYAANLDGGASRPQRKLTKTTGSDEEDRKLPAKRRTTRLRNGVNMPKKVVRVHDYRNLSRVGWKL